MTSALPIKFSHDYEKIPSGWEGQEVTLLAVQKTSFEELPEDFVEWDTAIRGGGHYPLPTSGPCLILVFYGYLKRTHDLVFSTVRSWSAEKEAYYRRNLFQNFQMVRSEVAERAKT